MADEFSDLAQNMVMNIERKENGSYRNKFPSQTGNRTLNYSVATALDWCPAQALSLHCFVLLCQEHEQDNTNSRTSLQLKIPPWSDNFHVGM